MLQIVKKAPSKKHDLHCILQAVIRNEGTFNIEHKEKKMCRNCKIPLKLEDKWLLAVPNIYTIGL